MARRLALSLLREEFSQRGLAQPRQRALPMTQLWGATPLPILGTPRLLKSVPMLGMPLPLGMMSPLEMVPPGPALQRVMAPILAMPLLLGTMSLPEMAPLPRIALLLPETASLLVMTPILAMPLLLGMMSQLEMAPLRGMMLLLGTVSLLKMMFQPVEVQNHQGQTSLAFRTTPAEY